MAEWSNAAVLKTVVPKGTGGSNPSLSATLKKWFFKREEKPRRGFDGAQRRRATAGWGEARSAANQSLSSSLRSSGVVALLLEPLRHFTEVTSFEG